jgi:hypothetical protein
MDQWRLDAIFALLEMDDVHFVEPTRAYLSSAIYGNSRYHMIDKLPSGSVQIEQTTIDEKWGSRVKVEHDELPSLLKVLLDWYLEGQRPTAAPEESLGDLDDHPF